MDIWIAVYLLIGLAITMFLKLSDDGTEKDIERGQFSQKEITFFGAMESLAMVFFWPIFLAIRIARFFMK